MGIVDPHDLPLVSELGHVFVLKELHSGQPGAGKGELNGVTPDLPLVGYVDTHVVLRDVVLFQNLTVLLLDFLSVVHCEKNAGMITNTISLCLLLFCFC